MNMKFLDITINLSKPEKIRKLLPQLKRVKAASYPKCALCIENEGYAGRVNHPAGTQSVFNSNNSKWACLMFITMSTHSF